MWFLISSFGARRSEVFADLRTSINNLAGNVYLCGSRWGDLETRRKKSSLGSLCTTSFLATDILKSLIMSDVVRELDFIALMVERTLELKITSVFFLLAICKCDIFCS
jgi:hypothetical protein